MSLENLYGRKRVSAEAKVVGQALCAVATRETAHPDDRDGWSVDNPTHGHCDLFTQICAIIWARTVTGKPMWNPEARRLVWWVYANYEALLEGERKNKLDVHYTLEHPNYGEIDLSRVQFPDWTHLHPRPRPLSHEIPVGRSWDKSCDIPRRKQMIGPDFISAFLKLPLPAELTPELDIFLEGLARGETFGLTA